MATTGKKEYTLKINGIDTAVKDITALETAVNSLDTSLNKVTNTSVKVTGTAKERTKALTEEEKAEQKLINTIDKVVQARSDANKAQIEANIAAREAQREVTREIQIRQQADGSIKQMGMQLTDLRNKYEGLSKAEREDLAVGGELLTQIQALDKEYKALRESTGNFRDSVGNYEKALSGLGQLSEGLEGVSKSSIGLAQGLLGANQLMAMFGNESEESAEQAKQLQKIIALLSIAQQVNTNVLKKGIVQGKLSAVTTAIQTAQTKAKTAAEAASTKGTIAATAAQKIFNLVASANPYVLLALALVAVGTALFAFARNTKSAADEQRELNDRLDRGRKLLDDEAEILTRYSKFRQDSLQRQIDYLKTVADAEAKNGVVSKKRIDEIRKLEDDLNDERKRHAQEMTTKYGDDIRALDKNKEKIIELQNQLKELNRYIDKKAKINFKIDGKELTDKVENAIELTQKEIDKTKNSINVALDVIDLARTANVGSAKSAEQRKKEDQDRAKTAAEAAKKRADTELSIVRAAEDARIKLIQDSNEQTRKTLALTYDRQIEDLRKRLTTEKDLTVKARAALNETITSLEKQKGLDLEKLEKEQANRALALQQELEDSRIALIVGNYDRQTAEVNLQYDRQIEAYKKRLDEDKTLTEEQQKQITELIINAQKARGIALANMTNEQLNQQTDLQLTAVEDALKKIENKVGEAVVRSKTGLELIDVKATRDNFDTLNKGLTDYMKGLSLYQIDLKKSHEDTLKTMQEGTPEYEAEVGRYARAYEEAAENIKSAQKEIEDNTKISARIQGEAFAELIGKISEYANVAASALTSVFDAWNMGLQAEMDDLNKQLDAINERYEDAQKQREGAVKNVEDIEARLQTATGGTAEALKEQLRDSMSARNEAIRAEQKLAKEKERIEAEQAKKEKQMKRNDLLSQIAQTVANTAAGVAKAVAAAPLTFGLPWSAFVAATGALQTGIMVKQLTKLANGGEIIGPSHANGGVPILVNGEHRYEAQGGEFMVNDKSYGANKPLVNFINDTPRTITAADLFGMVPNDATPVVMVEAGFPDEDRIIEAINGINFQPVVAVKDINDVSDEVVTVKDLADF